MTSCKLFTHEEKQNFEDCFVDAHNQIVSAVFKCNTNLCAMLDGGSMCCVTCHATKSTTEEDEIECHKAAI